MVDFASVYQLANKPTVPLENYGDAMGKALQLKSLQQQTQMGAMQGQQLGQQIQDAQDLRQTLQSSTSLDDALAKAQKLGSPAAQGFIKNALEMKEKGVKLSADQFKLANDHLAKVGNDLVGAANSPGITPQALTSMIQAHAQQGNIPAAQAQEMIGQIPQNAADIPLWGRLQAVKLGSAPDVLKMFTPQSHFTGGVAAKVDPLSGDVISTERVKGYSDAPHAGIGPDGKPGFFQLDESGKVPSGWRPIPPAAGGMGGHGMGTPAANASAGAGSAQERLAGVPADLQALVKSVGTYKILSSQLSPRQKNQTMGYVAQVFPNYSAADAEANMKFIKDLAAGGPASAGGAIGASERLLGHLGEAADLTDKLGNSSLGKIGNVIGQGFSKASGTGNAGDVKAFELVKGKVIAELNKLANGGVPEARQMADDVKTLVASDPSDVKYKVLKAAASLGLEQTHALEAKRDNLLGEFSTGGSFLSPRAQNVVGRIWKNAGEGDPGLAAPTTGSGYTTTQQNKETMGGVQVKPSSQPMPKTVSLADVRATAQKYGKSVDQVMKDLAAKGIGVQ